MAIYNCSFGIIKRSAGKSVVNAAAYRAGEALFDQRLGMRFDYSQKPNVITSEILLPPTAPDWMLDREKLWNSVEKIELRRDAQLARDVVLSLPRELPLISVIERVREFVHGQFVARGMVCDLAIHCPSAGDNDEQPHVHLLLSLRKVSIFGWSKMKERTWNRKAFLAGVRVAWAETLNVALEGAGSHSRVDHRRLDVRLAEKIKIAEDAQLPLENRLEAIEATIELDHPPQPTFGRSSHIARSSKKKNEELAQKRRDHEEECRRRRFLRIAWATTLRGHLIREFAQEIGTRIAGRISQAVEAHREGLLAQDRLAWLKQTGRYALRAAPAKAPDTGLAERPHSVMQNFSDPGME